MQLIFIGILLLVFGYQQLLLMADMMLTLELLSQKYFLLKAQEKKLKFINRKKLIRQNCPNN
ncbi:unnamed protein product [Callosobruchus maculatus]|uniref:Uncharacterized protein n=1 Tax=Callosobruchus maculatus TaxID=64391 RepID=A0A653CHU2_CALMS|nr:unnamed protein product [Callosobruchus maculatus]